MFTLIIGVRINGINNIGFKTIGKPNNNGSLILKIPGAADNFPKVLYCLFYLATMLIPATQTNIIFFIFHNPPFMESVCRYTGIVHLKKDKKLSIMDENILIDIIKI